MQTFNGLTLFMMLVGVMTLQYLMKKLIKTRKIKRINHELRRRNS